MNCIHYNSQKRWHPFTFGAIYSVSSGGKWFFIVNMRIAWSFVVRKMISNRAQPNEKRKKTKEISTNTHTHTHIGMVACSIDFRFDIRRAVSVSTDDDIVDLIQLQWLCCVHSKNDFSGFIGMACLLLYFPFRQTFSFNVHSVHIQHLFYLIMSVVIIFNGCTAFALNGRVLILTAWQTLLSHGFYCRCE